MKRLLNIILITETEISSRKMAQEHFSHFRSACIVNQVTLSISNKDV